MMRWNREWGNNWLSHEPIAWTMISISKISITTIESLKKICTYRFEPSITPKEQVRKNKVYGPSCFRAEKDEKMLNDLFHVREASFKNETTYSKFCFFGCFRICFAGVLLWQIRVPRHQRNILIWRGGSGKTFGGFVLPTISLFSNDKTMTAAGATVMVVEVTWTTTTLLVIVVMAAMATE